LQFRDGGVEQRLDLGIGGSGIEPALCAPELEGEPDKPLLRPVV
jgi:hypothetical protein